MENYGDTNGVDVGEDYFIGPKLTPKGEGKNYEIKLALEKIKDLER